MSDAESSDRFFSPPTSPPHGSTVGVDGERKPPEVVIDPNDSDPVLVRDVLAELDEAFDVELDTATEHIRAWTVTR